jgi:HK97 family phage portal protein
MQAEMDRTANRWNWNFFKNGASIGSMLSTDQSMSPENKELLIRKWKQQFQGVANGHSVAVLDNGLKYTSVPNSKREMDFVESRRFTRDEIFSIFKVPPAVI